MAQEDGCLLVRVGGRNHVLDFPAQEQVAAQTEDTTQLAIVRQARDHRHGAALGEATDDYTVCGDALGHLGVDEGVEVVARLEDTLFVILAAGQVAQALDVVPTRHLHPHVLARPSATISPNIFSDARNIRW